MKITKTIKLVAACFALLVLSACASGPKLSELAPENTQAHVGQSQIVIYRTQIIGAALQPWIYVDGTQTGECTSKGVFIVDVEPGDYDVHAKTETESRARVTVPKNGRAYVRCSIGIGLFIGRPKLQIVPENIGENESNELSFTGRFQK